MRSTVGKFAKLVGAGRHVGPTALILLIVAACAPLARADGAFVMGAGDPITATGAFTYQTWWGSYENGTRTRTDLGIGESVKLDLQLSTFRDADKFKATCDGKTLLDWTDVMDRLGGVGFRLKGPEPAVPVGVLHDSSFTLGITLENDICTGHGESTFTAFRGTVDVKVKIEALVSDLHQDGLVDDIPDKVVDFKEFSIWTPKLEFLTAVNPPAWAANLGLTYPGSEYIGGRRDRLYRLVPQNVNFDALLLGESIPQFTVYWPSGPPEVVPPTSLWAPPGTVGSQKGVIYDYHSVLKPYSYIAATSGDFSYNCNGMYFGWFSDYNGLYYGGPPVPYLGINWIHEFDFSDYQLTLTGNGDSYGTYGPWDGP